MIRIIEDRDYSRLKHIKYLYHWVIDSKQALYCQHNGITRDSDGFVYLSEKPFNETSPAWDKDDGFTFRVRIPNNDLLSYWEDFWTDEDGNEIDFDHQAIPGNQYYIYEDDIPKEFIELVR